MMYAIVNNTTVAPVSKISEYDDIVLQLVEGTEEEIKEEARRLGLTRIHFYEKHEDETGYVTYNYLTTIGV